MTPRGAGTSAGGRSPGRSGDLKTLLLALDAYSGTGGIQSYLRRVVRALGEEGVATTGVHLWDRHQDVPPGQSIYGCDRRKIRFLVRAAAELVRGRPDVVLLGHVLLWPLGLLARVLRPRARVVLLAYGDEVWDKPPAFRRLGIARSAEVVIAVSRHTARRMQEAYGLAAGRFALVEPAVDAPAEIAPAHERRPTILTVSRLADRYKGIDKLVEAMATIRNTVPQARLVVVGDGPLRGELEALSASRGLNGAVRFTGTLSDEALDSCYGEAALFALPSTEEGYGIVFLEAWARGLPVVAATRGAAAEVVDGDRTGVLVDPDDPAAIAHAIVALLLDPERRVLMGATGRERVTQQNTHEVFRRSLASVVRDQARASERATLTTEAAR